MQVISHRGYWKQATEKNQLVSFERSFGLNFGTETDVRDRNGRLVISHDMPDGSEMHLDDLIKVMGTRNDLPLAINIKADGLADAISCAFKGSSIPWFVFDMSIPDTRKHLNAGNPVFMRMSDVEQNPPWPDETKGVWLDTFDEDWFEPELVKVLLLRGLQVCVVSPDLHGRINQPLWNEMLRFRNTPGVMLCTDAPEEARHFFSSTRS